MSWRYMPARETSGGLETWAISEVYIDHAGISWVGSVHPSGDTHEELLSDLRRMLNDAECDEYLDLNTGTIRRRRTNGPSKGGAA